MEPFEWVLVIAGVAVIGLLGTRGRSVVKSAAKGYLSVEEKAKTMTAGLRKEVHEAVEEAREERAKAVEKPQ
jgi:hypothetical protein